MRLGNKPGQSILEYSLLVSIILSSLLIMQIYVKRCYQGRLKQEADSLGRQYSPGHTTSLMVTNTNVTSVSCTGGNCLYNGTSYAVPDGMTVTFSQSKSNFEQKEAVDSFALD